MPITMNTKLNALINTIYDIARLKHCTVYSYVALVVIFKLMIAFGTYSHPFIENNQDHYSHYMSLYVISV